MKVKTCILGPAKLATNGKVELQMYFFVKCRLYLDAVFPSGGLGKHVKVTNMYFGPTKLATKGKFDLQMYVFFCEV
jgi:hypothetical protein